MSTCVNAWRLVLSIVFSGHVFHPLPRAACGATSAVYVSKYGLLVLKAVRCFQEYSVYEREKVLLESLQAYAWCPTLIHRKKARLSNPF